MKLNELKKPAIYGVIVVLIVLIIEGIILLTCKNSLACVGLAFVVLSPGMIFQIPQGNYFEILFDIIFYFFIGGLVGFLVQKFRNKYVENNNKK